MMTERAQVVAVDEGWVTLSTTLKSGCQSCQQVSHCGAGILSKIQQQRQRELVVFSPQPVQPGEWVDVCIPDAVITKFSLLVFGLPLLLFIVSALLLQLVGAPEGAVIMTAAGVFAASFWGLRRYLRGRDMQLRQGIQILQLDGTANANQRACK